MPGPTKANPLVPKVVSSVPFAEYLEMRVRLSLVLASSPTTMIFPSAETFIAETSAALVSGEAINVDPPVPNELSIVPFAFRRYIRDSPAVVVDAVTNILLSGNTTIFVGIMLSTVNAAVPDTPNVGSRIPAFVKPKTTGLPVLIGCWANTRMRPLD
ncbi:unannotated protein [freshwater metagenome]|uniref:Unannotated protein n=1 Tax=freshwater metagenome TaxID=449393 RepID=A0A6J7S7Z2_9ZZZZ